MKDTPAMPPGIAADDDRMAIHHRLPRDREQFLNDLAAAREAAGQERRLTKTEKATLVRLCQVGATVFIGNMGHGRIGFDTVAEQVGPPQRNDDGSILFVARETAVAPIASPGEIDKWCDAAQARLRTARPAVRTRGAGRPKAQATRSSARSGDSGDDSDSSSDSSEPAPRRLCAFCGKDIPPERSPKATHCSDKHAANDRKRRQRQRERERSKLPPTPQPADYWRMREITDQDRKRLWELAVCRCNGHHIELEPGWCCKCGHPLPHKLKDGPERYAAFMKRLAEPTVVQRLPGRDREQVAP
jgi:hypothetical protein